MPSSTRHSNTTRNPDTSPGAYRETAPPVRPHDRGPTVRQTGNPDTAPVRAGNPVPQKRTTDSTTANQKSELARDSASWEARWNARVRPSNQSQ
jgi:hypothetical protein